ncbi:hypothetical protein D9M71_296730 [compost metagenome]
MALEGQAEQGGDRAEGDVALFPGQAQAEHFLAFPLALADHADVGHAAGVRAGQRAGQGEAGDFLALRQARQVVLALLVGAVVQQQFGRAEGVRHHHRGGEVAAAGGELHHHLGVGEGGEALAAVFLGDDQAEEALLPDEGPGVFRQVHAPAELPVVDHGAELLGGAVDEGLLLFAQLRARVVQQLVPVRPAAEQLAVPPHGAGLDGLALGVGHRRQRLAEPGEQRRAEQRAAQVRQQQREGDGEPRQPEQDHPGVGMAEQPHEDQVDGDDAERERRSDAPVGQPGHAEDQYHQPEQQHAGFPLDKPRQSIKLRLLAAKRSGTGLRGSPIDAARMDERHR